MIPAMRIAIQNSLPNHPNIAEAEWLKRAAIACGRLGYDVVECVTSDDILACEPDCVLVTHEYSPKLTHYPTLGLNWSPPAFFADDPLRQRAILSLDGHLCGSHAIAEWIGDFLAGFSKMPVLHDRIFLPSTHDCGPPAKLPGRPSIMYAGTHWDGSRHGQIFAGLEGRVAINLYGAPAAWTDRGESYRGQLPFDGESVIGALRESGVALCLHKHAHRQANCPSMRLFEAAAAGAVIITDDFGFPREHFRDAVLYVDADLPADLVVGQIVEHMHWISDNPDAANRLAGRSNALFRDRLTLEHMFAALPEFVDRVRSARGMVPCPTVTAKREPTVEYVVRVGSRPKETIEKALRSLADQTYPSLAITIVEFHPVEGLDDLIADHRPRFEWIRHVIVANNGNRATCWWAGLNAVTAPFFAFLDDDDSLFPNHVRLLMDKLEQRPEFGLAYSGLIRIEDEPGHFISMPNFVGPSGQVIEERRELFALEKETFTNFTPIRNVIGHNSWICRRSVLEKIEMTDPAINWAEDVFFLALIAGHSDFGFTGSATANWHWRSTSRDNWTLSHPSETYKHSLARWRGRLQDVALPAHNRIEPPGQWFDLQETLDRDSE
jgi:phosphoglycerol transferase